ncbi:hypothetical protein [Streptomyces sp. NPDC050145]|uniref:hypothetical protein n=1 Tax=Streptomyces sp. NPDC050145 TaxID=3365602 RepID=UPI003788FBB6
MAKVRVMLVTGTVGWNHPDAPLVSVPLPATVLVAGSQVGASVSVPTWPHTDGFGVDRQ